MKKETQKTLLIVTIYAIAMGFLESVVVIYLRKLYYPNGFDFPLKGFIDPSVCLVIFCILFYIDRIFIIINF